ncbi:hypothetical protein FORC065_3666 [Yersinia enterocolitica]|nr:hypothetical protein FORC065_3666 [Yersinia enterocolitica]
MQPINLHCFYINGTTSYAGDGNSLVNSQTYQSEYNYG